MSFCIRLWSVYNSRPIPQTSAEQLRIEFIPVTRFIIVVTKNSDTGVSAVWSTKYKNETYHFTVHLGKYALIKEMRFPQYITRYKRLCHIYISDCTDIE